MFYRLSKHLEFRQKYSAARLLFSMFGHPDETLFLAFDILHILYVWKDNHSIRFTYLNAITFFIMHKVDCIKTPGHVILRDPLIEILSPLYRHLDNLGCFSKITLEPLEMVVVFSWPGPHVSSPTPSVESRQVRVMVTIPRGCCCYLVVLNTTWLHSHWSVAKNTWWRLKMKSKLSTRDACTDCTWSVQRFPASLRSKHKIS